MTRLIAGQPAPDFTLPDQDGQPVSLSQFRGKKVLVYFYPRASTPGCTTQACSFRDAYQDFQDLGAEVIGVSGDSVSSHQNFQQKHKLPFILLSDSDRKLRKLFGVPTALFGLIPGRVTYVFDASGKAIYIFDNMSAKNHITKALEAIKKSK